MDRRGFLRAFGIGGAAATAIIHAAPDVKAHEMRAPGDHVQPSTPKPTDAMAEIEKQVGLIAAEAALRIGGLLRWYACKIALHKSEHIAMKGDTMVLPDGGRVILVRHMESTFPVLDLNELVADGGVKFACMAGACFALAEAISRDCEGRNVLCYARHPLPIRGLGAIAARDDSARVSVRAILCYAPEYLNHHMTIDTLYGMA